MNKREHTKVIDIWAKANMVSGCLFLAHEKGEIDLDRPLEQFPQGLRLLLETVGEICVASSDLMIAYDKRTQKEEP